LERPSTLTDKITSSASDIGHLRKVRCQRCRGTGANYVVNPDTSERANANRRNSLADLRFRVTPA